MVRGGAKTKTGGFKKKRKTTEKKAGQAAMQPAANSGPRYQESSGKKRARGSDIKNATMAASKKK